MRTSTILLPRHIENKAPAAISPKVTFSNLRPIASDEHWTPNDVTDAVIVRSTLTTIY